MIKLFISSTFRDMQLERDVINRNVMPRLRSRAMGESIYCTDLRWGINTDEMDGYKGMEKILTVCMREIDESQHFVILLGDRYGSVPNEGVLKGFLKGNYGKTFSADEVVGKSITELELMHAMHRLSQESRNHITVCLREIERSERLPESLRERLINEGEAEKVARLKALLRDQFPDSVLEYKVSWDPQNNVVMGLDEFAERLLNRLLANMRDRLPKRPVSQQEKRLYYSRTILRRSLEGMVPLGEELGACQQFLDSGRVLVFFGGAGSGKTTRLGALAESADKSGFQIISLMQSCGDGPDAESEFMRDALFALDPKSYDNELVKDASSAALREQLAQTVTKATKGGRLLFLLDDIDRYDPSTRTRLLRTLPVENDCVRVALAAQTPADLPIFLSANYPVTFQDVGAQGTNLARRMVHSTLAVQGKELSEDLVEAIINASIQRTPLYTRLMLSCISGLGAADFSSIERLETHESGSRRIHLYMNQLLERLPGDEAALASTLLKMVEQQVGVPLADFLTNMLCMFPSGLRMEDIVGIYAKAFPMGKVSEVDVVLFVDNSADLFCKDNEWIRLNHLLFETDRAYCEALLPSVLSYLNALPNVDSLKLSWCIPVAQQLAEYDLAATYLRNCAEAIPSLLTHLFSEGRHLNANELLQIMRVAEGWGPQEVSDFVAAFLYSFDTLFHLANVSDSKTIMDELYRLCMDHIYPQANKALEEDKSTEAVIQYRNCYVCCEQRGIRTSYYATQKDMYTQFYNMSLRLFELSEVEGLLQVDDILRGTILDDYCTAIDKLASLQSYSMPERLSMIDRACDLLSSHAGAGAISSERIIHHRDILRFHKAEILVEKGVVNARIGWPDDIVTEHLPEIEGTVQALVAHHSSTGSYANERGGWICQGYMVLADAYRSTIPPKTADELAATKLMLDAAEQWYRLSGEVKALDMMRNARMRLALDDEALPAAERCRHLKESCEAMFLMKGIVPDDRLFRIAQVEFRELIDQYYKYVSSLVDVLSTKSMSGNAASVKDSALRAIVEACCEAISIVEHDGLFKVSFFSSEREEGRTDSARRYVFFRDVLLLSSKLMYGRMISLARSNAFEPACEIAERLHRAMETLDLVAGDVSFLHQAQDIYSGISVVYHNFAVMLSDDGPFGARVAGEVTYNSHQAFEQDDFYLARTGYYYQREILVDPNAECRYVRAKSKRAMLGWDEIVSNSFILTASYAFSHGTAETERFWSFVQNHRNQFGMRLMYFVSADSKAMSTHEHFNVVGDYLVRHLVESRTLELLVKNDLFEAISLEYAYRKNLREAAHVIIYNGYRCFLELPLVLIIRTYDRKEYELIMPELVPACLRRLEKDCKWLSTYGSAQVKPWVDCIYGDVKKLKKRAR